MINFSDKSKSNIPEAMSFPRTVPVAPRKVNLRIRKMVMRGGILYAVGIGCFGEYMGWWEKFSLNKDPNNPADILEMVQHDDEQSWKKMSRLMSQVSVEDNLKKGREQFVDSLPIGMKNAIRDDDL